MGAVLQGQTNAEEWCVVGGVTVLREIFVAFLTTAESRLQPPETRRLTAKQHAAADCLLSAVRSRDTQSLEYLISAGADVNVCDTRGNTPLILAIQNNDGKSIC